jgi:TPR repeat protein
LRRTTHAAFLALGLLALGPAALGTAALAGPFEDGQAAFARGEEAAAFAIWKPLAEQGDANAQFRLGEMYDLGRGVPRDYAQAAVWYRRAAEQGVAIAQHDLARMYEVGDGLTVSEYSLTAAASWYRRAAVQGYKPSQGNLGILYATGRGVKRNYLEACTWFILAGAEANRAAMAAKLSPQDIATAERRAREFKAKPER